jgi:hypothetical protein
MVLPRSAPLACTGVADDVGDLTDGRVIFFVAADEDWSPAIFKIGPRILLNTKLSRAESDPASLGADVEVRALKMLLLLGEEAAYVS